MSVEGLSDVGDTIAVMVDLLARLSWGRVSSWDDGYATSGDGASIDSSAAATAGSLSASAKAVAFAAACRACCKGDGSMGVGGGLDGGRGGRSSLAFLSMIDGVATGWTR